MWGNHQTFLDRLKHACVLYQRGQLNLSGAARYANIGVERMMRALTRRGVKHSPPVEQFADGLETLAVGVAKGVCVEKMRLPTAS